MTAYTLFSQPANPASLTDDSADYTMGVQFSVNQSGCTLTAVWFWSAPGAGALPDTIALYAVTGASLVHSETASWSGAAGSGWVRAAFSSPPSLTSGTNYKAAIFENTGNFFYSGTPHYWDTGPGAGGITNGPLSAPANSGADGGQDTFTNSSSLSYPSTSFNAANYWVDPEVSHSGGLSHNATASLTVTPSFTAARTRGTYRTGSLTVVPAFRAARIRGKYRTAALTVNPAFAAARTAGRYRTGSLTVAPAFSTALTRGHYRTAALAVTPGFTTARVHGHYRHAALTCIPAFAVTWSGGAVRPGAVFTVGDPRWAWVTGNARNQ